MWPFHIRAASSVVMLSLPLAKIVAHFLLKSLLGYSVAYATAVHFLARTTLAVAKAGGRLKAAVVCGLAPNRINTKFTVVVA